MTNAESPITDQTDYDQGYVSPWLRPGTSTFYPTSRAQRSEEHWMFSAVSVCLFVGGFVCQYDNF